jgi:hypothetical protein
MDLNMDLENQILQYHQELRIAEEELVALKKKMLGMRDMSTQEVIERDVQNVLIGYGLVKILDAWQTSKDAKERAAMEKLLDYKFELKGDYIQVTTTNKLEAVEP